MLRGTLRPGAVVGPGLGPDPGGFTQNWGALGTLGGGSATPITQFCSVAGGQQLG